MMAFLNEWFPFSSRSCLLKRDDVRLTLIIPQFWDSHVMPFLNVCDKDWIHHHRWSDFAACSEYLVQQFTKRKKIMTRASASIISQKSTSTIATGQKFLWSVSVSNPLLECQCAVLPPKSRRCDSCCSLFAACSSWQWLLGYWFDRQQGATRPCSIRFKVSIWSCWYYTLTKILVAVAGSRP